MNEFVQVLNRVSSIGSWTNLWLSTKCLSFTFQCIAIPHYMFSCFWSPLHTSILFRPFTRALLFSTPPYFCILISNTLFLWFLVSSSISSRHLFLSIPLLFGHSGSHCVISLILDGSQMWKTTLEYKREHNEESK